MKLFKSTIIIWTDYDPAPRNIELSALAREAEVGDAYCSKQETELIVDPETDADWDGTEFFELSD